VHAGRHGGIIGHKGLFRQKFVGPNAFGKVMAPAKTHERAPAHWEHFSHVADVGVRGFGRSMDEAFEQAALALTAVITEPGSVRPLQAVEVACEAPHPEILLADWLNALVFEMAIRHMLFSRFEVHIAGQRLTAKAWGEPVDVARHQPAAEVKGATLSELAVAVDPDGRWRAQCIVDV
jgi:SHS2 domain-containing protein